LQKKAPNILKSLDAQTKPPRLEARRLDDGLASLTLGLCLEGNSAFVSGNEIGATGFPGWPRRSRLTSFAYGGLWR
jgi:hypothetical protein